MTDLKRELNEVSRAKESLERLSYQLVDEVRQTKNKVESQQVELQQAAQEFKNKSKRLEEENRQMVSQYLVLLVDISQSKIILYISNFLAF